MRIRMLLVVILGTAQAGCTGQSPGESCSADEDCPAGRFCRVSIGECVFDCLSGSDCPEDFVCTNRGRCERGCVQSNLGVEDCDGEDNDCDGETDNIESRACFLDNEHGRCEGTERCLGGGWICDAVQATAEDCDGEDNDCDGETDEELASTSCPLQEGVCVGALRSCQGHDGWTPCDYGPDHEVDEELSCDLMDNDCDGETDEAVTPLPDCELGFLAGDGIDNNCNGVVDEPGGCMVEIGWYPGTYIDTYEGTVFENADCTGQRFGEDGNDYPVGWPPGSQDATVTLYACSLPGLRPSRSVTWYQARRACEALGKRLCTKEEWAMACNGGAGRDFPYGEVYLPAFCNTFSNGVGDTVPAGSMSDCVSDTGVYDLSGNLWEWARDPCEWQAGWRDIQGGSYRCGVEIDGQLQDCDMDDPLHQQAIHAAHSCQIPFQGWYCNGADHIAHDEGVRCCYDAP